MNIKDNKIYTGREIAIFTDCHSLLEPLEAVLEDIEKRGIKEIYSLGDNVGVGPNPAEVVDLINEHNVISIAGNSEDYCTLGIEPFSCYFDNPKIESQLWTLKHLRSEHIDNFKLYPHSVDLVIGGKKIALCHFANDIRIDFLERSCWNYLSKMDYESKPYKQFLYTNSNKQKEEIRDMLEKYDHTKSELRGYLSANEKPLFEGKSVQDYDTIIQGHLHFRRYEKSPTTEYYSIRGLEIAYENDPIDTASYIILKEKINNMGYDLQEVLIKYDREKMKRKILETDFPNGMIKKYTNIE